MARRPRGGLEYGGAPDLVQPGAPVRQDGTMEVPDRTKSSRPKASRPGRTTKLEYDPEPFPGARAPAGPSESAQETLRARGLVESTQAPAESTAGTPVVTREVAAAKVAGAPRATATLQRAAEPSRKPAPAKKRTTAKPSRPAKPSRTARQSTPAAPRRKSAPKRRAAPAKSSEKRTARTVRLAPNVEAKLQQIAATFGVDLNAAIAVAITHGFKALQDVDLVRPVEPGNERVDDR